MNRDFNLKKYLPYLYILLGFLVVYAILRRLPQQRVGDGSEYYALFYAWDTAHRPWMTSLAYDAYERLFSINHIAGMVSRESLESMFPALRLAGTSDFNHFWLYSLLAFSASKVVSLFGVESSPHVGFLTLHYLLLVLVTSLAYRYFNWRGALVVLLMTFVSPILWFLDKVHVEVFTYALVLSAIILVYARQYVSAAFFMALASTQNPSFSLIALVLLFYRVFLEMRRSYSFFELVFFVGTVLAALLHPIYYFFRFGVPTPQLLAGGASFGSNLSYFYIWVLDPDLGLLPNWPLGLLFCVCSIVFLFFQRGKLVAESVRWSYLVFVVVYLCVNFYANSSTENLNSGATPGLARYALWYMPIIFPIAYYVLQRVPLRLFYVVPSLVVLAVLVVFSIRENDPRKPERYSTPTLLSFLIQSKRSGLYNPPPEVFAERYSGFGEAIGGMNVRGVVGPDCKKMLIFPDVDEKGVRRTLRGVVQHECLFDVDKLNDFSDGLSLSAKKPSYVEVDRSVVPQMTVLPGAYKVGLGQSGNFLLGSGWSVLEAWGAWSEGGVASFRIPCAGLRKKEGEDISFSMVLQPFGDQRIKVKSSGRTLWRGTISGPSADVDFSIPAVSCATGVAVLSVHISDPKSPKETGLSGDGRKLGVGIKEFKIM